MSRLQRWGFKSNTGTPGNGNGPTSPSTAHDGLNGNNRDAADEGQELEERFFGLENFGNTCYCNSVLQALYHCPAFRQSIASFPAPPAPFIPIGPTPDQIKETTAQLAASQALAAQNEAAGSPLTPSAASLAGVPGVSAVDGERKTTPTPKRTWSMAGRKQSTNAVQQAVNANGGTAPLKSPGPASLNTASGGWPASPGQPSTPGGVPFPSQPAQAQAPPPSAAANAIASGPPPTMLSSLQTLFEYIGSSPAHPPAAPKAVPPGQTSGGPVALGPHSLAARGGGAHGAGTLGRGVARPDELVRTVRRENELFRSTMHQDAHEFLGWLLNKVAEDAEALQREGQYGAGSKAGANGAENAAALGKTFIHTLFEGVLTNETRCLTCETTSSRDEAFLDLSIDIEQNSSVTACLRQFSASEMLCQKNKFFCDTCCGLQEAEKRMKIRKLPNVLALHLKRFKYQEQVQRYIKLSYRVVFPFQLRLFNTSDDVADPDRLYELFAVVVHIGIGPHHGHYVAIVRTEGRWILCDDENIEPIEESDIPRYFGDYPAGSGYVLFYQAVDIDLASMGLKNQSPPAPAPAPAATASAGDLMTPGAEHEELLTSEPDEAVFTAGALSPMGVTQDSLAPLQEQESPNRRLSSPTSSSAPMPRADIRQRQDSAPSDVGQVGFSSNAAARTPSLSPRLGRYSTPPQQASESGRSQDSGVRRFSTPPIQTQSDSVKSKESSGNWFSRTKSSKDKDASSKRSSMFGASSSRRDESYFPATSSASHVQRHPTDASMSETASNGGNGLGLTVKAVGYSGTVSSSDPSAIRQSDTDTNAPSMSASFISTVSVASNGYGARSGASPGTPSPAIGLPASQGSRPGLSSSATFSTLAGLGRKSKGKDEESPKDRVPSGGSLTRKLSVGMPGRASLTRSSSAAFKSMGFGKKSKDKTAAQTLEES